MRGKFDGKAALVTGGNSGIGRATALAFAREGAKVVIAARQVSEGQETVRMIQDAGGEALFIQTDVSRAAEVETMVNKTIEAYGRLDWAFNNAGIVKRASFIDLTEEDFDQVIAVNLKGVWLCMKYEIHQMLDQGGGAIVNMSSGYGVSGTDRGVSVYSASKHGVIGLTRCAALEYAKSGIRVNAVAPGWIRTPMLESGLRRDPQLEGRILDQEPVGRMGTPEEIAEAVVWLCSDAASFVTGHSMVIDGGVHASWGL